MTAATYRSLRPHFREREYCFAGTAFPRDSGVGGVKLWNLWFCIERLETVDLHALLTCTIEGREACLVQVCRERLEIREKENRALSGFACQHLRPLRCNSPAVRSDIFFKDVFYKVRNVDPPKKIASRACLVRHRVRYLISGICSVN